VFPRYGVHPGASPTVCFAAPPLDACGFAALRASPGWTPSLGLPKGLKIKSQIKAKAKAKPKPKPDQKIAAFGSSHMGLSVFS
jgi:hypothetical protein